MWKNQKQIRSSLILGKALAKYRTIRRLTPKGLADALSIPQEIVLSLESGHYTSFHSYSEVERILKRMAYLFDLNSSELIKLYCHEYQVLYGRKAFDRHQGLITSRSNPWITDRTVRFMVIGGAFCLLVSYIGSQMYMLARGPGIYLDQDSAYQIVQSEEYTISGSVESGSRLTLNGEGVTLESDGRFSIVIGLLQGPNHLEFTVQRGDSRTQTIQKIVYRQ